VLRSKIQAYPEFADYKMTWWKVIAIQVLVSAVMFGLWVMIYKLYNDRYFVFHGLWVGCVGLPLADALLVFAYCPKQYTKEQFRETFILIFVKSFILFCLQAIFLCIASILYNYLNRAAAAILIFTLTRLIFNHVADALCKYCNTPDLRVIFTNTNRMFNRLFTLWVLASNFEPISVITLGSVEFASTPMLIFFVVGPLGIHLNKKSIPNAAYLWMLGKEDKQNCASNLSEEDFNFAVRERAK